MTAEASLLPLAAMAASAGAVPAILLLRHRPNLREGATMAAAVAQFLVVMAMVPGALDGASYRTDVAAFGDGLGLALHADPLGLLFAVVASGLWIPTSLYSVGYMRGLDAERQTRYFAAFAASLSATMGVAFAADLLTLFVSYELLTVATYPLVTHDQDAEARAAGRKYLAYTFAGGVLVLAGTALVQVAAGSVGFAPGGIAGLAADASMARLAFGLLIAGFGVKAAVVPLHGWLPDAMVAPTPVSGLLHAVAVVKSGVFGIARVVLEVHGVDLVGDLGLGAPLAAVAAATILLASLAALRQDALKRRLAYSTISQLSYIVLGLAVLHPLAVAGGLLHLPAHAVMKLTLFFCAGAIHVETHTDRISRMAGIGRRMPLTMAAFAVASAGMAGIPLVAGFVSKWYLSLGGVAAGQPWIAGVLLLSGVLNVAYFWPIVYTAFFERREDAGPRPRIADGSDPDGGGGGDTDDVAAADGGTDEGPDVEPWERRGWRDEASWAVLAPIVAVAALAVLVGVAPDAAVVLRIVRTVVAAATGVTV